MTYRTFTAILIAVGMTCRIGFSLLFLSGCSLPNTVERPSSRTQIKTQANRAASARDALNQYHAAPARTAQLRGDTLTAQAHLSEIH